MTPEDFKNFKLLPFCDKPLIYYSDTPILYSRTFTEKSLFLLKKIFPDFYILSEQTDYSGNYFLPDPDFKSLFQYEVNLSKNNKLYLVSLLADNLLKKYKEIILIGSNALAYANFFDKYNSIFYYKYNPVGYSPNLIDKIDEYPNSKTPFVHMKEGYLKVIFFYFNIFANTTSHQPYSNLSLDISIIEGNHYAYIEKTNGEYEIYQVPGKLKKSFLNLITRDFLAEEN